MRIFNKLLPVALFAAVLLDGCTQKNDDPAYTVETFRLTAKTVQVTPLYGKTSGNGVLGKYSDPQFGTLDAGFLCSFFCPDDFRFRHTPENGQIDSINLDLVYEHGWAGDSLAPLTVHCYLMNRPLQEGVCYTDIDPGEYYNPKKGSLAAKTATAYDMTVPDAVRKEMDADGNFTFVPTLTLTFPREFGQGIYEATLTQPEMFRNSETFAKLLPGFYVTTEQSSGCTFRISAVRMVICYHYTEPGSGGVKQAAEVFDVNALIQKIEKVNDGDDLLKKAEESGNRTSYLNLAAGICTEITFPIREIREKTETGCRFDRLPLQLKFRPLKNWDDRLPPPEYVALIPAGSSDAFFENGRADNRTSFLSESCIRSTGRRFDPSYTGDYTYVFNDIAPLLEHQLATAPDEDLRMLVVPVEPEGHRDYRRFVTPRVTGYFAPSGVELSTGSEDLTIRVAGTEFTNR